jgi:hypothetical protein
MKVIQACVSLVLSCCLLLSADGTVPRTQATSYPNHIEIEGAAVGAILLKEFEVKERFATDLGREYLVAEVALYPRSGEELDVQTDNFILRIKGKETALKPENPKVIASLLLQTAPQKRDVRVVPYATIGYETGSRYPGYPGHDSGGLYTSTGVGVMLEDKGPTGTPQDEEVMVLELSEKSLPSGQTDKPVAGYLYFRVDKKTRQYSGDRYSLEFDMHDKTVTLLLSN